MIDFSRVQSREIKLSELAETVTVDDLRVASDESIDRMLNWISDLTDEQLRFIPVDEDADDPYAADESDKTIGWSVAHLILHVTASTEEGAAFASILGRGVPIGGRLRYEPDWRDKRFTSKEALIERLEESRRMRHACLDTLPAEPHADVYREVSERLEAFTGKLNYITSFLFGFMHEIGHYDQIKDVIKQAKEAIPTSA